jgi:hypothetical protein
MNPGTSQLGIRHFVEESDHSGLHVKSIVSVRFLISTALTREAANAKILNIRTHASVIFSLRGICRFQRMKAGMVVNVISQSELRPLWT